MTNNEKRMLELLKNANRAMSKRFPDMKKSQQEITEFLSSCMRPKSEYTEVCKKLMYDTFDDAIKAFEEFSNSINTKLLERESTEFIDFADMMHVHRIIQRRRENLRKTVDELFSEMENAYYAVTKETIPKQLIEDLSKFKQIMATKDVIRVVTVGKEMLHQITTQKNYYIDQILIFKINSIKFFVRMLEEKSLGYVIKKES